MFRRLHYHFSSFLPSTPRSWKRPGLEVSMPAPNLPSPSFQNPSLGRCVASCGSCQHRKYPGNMRSTLSERVCVSTTALPTHTLHAPSPQSPRPLENKLLEHKQVPDPAPAEVPLPPSDRILGHQQWNQKELCSNHIVPPLPFTDKETEGQRKVTGPRSPRE